MRVGSLCTGYGGLDCAVEQFFGAETAWYSEFEKHPSTLLAQRFPGIPNMGDLTELDWTDMGKPADLAGTFRMYDLYCQGLSLDQVAQREGITRQTVYTRFKRQQLDLRDRPPALAAIPYLGRKYTLGVNGYYRATEGDREYLHRAIWTAERGGIPAGFDVHHIDHDKTNNVIGNFECLPREDHARLHSMGCNQFGHKCGGGDATDSLAVDILTGGYP